MCAYMCVCVLFDTVCPGHPMRSIRLRCSLAPYHVARSLFRSVSAPGYEADDVMASLAVRGGGNGAAAGTIIATRDKDLFQVVRDGPSPAPVACYDPFKGAVVDEAAVRRRFGVSPGDMVLLQVCAAARQRLVHPIVDGNAVCPAGPQRESLYRCKKASLGQLRAPNIAPSLPTRPRKRR